MDKLYAVQYFLGSWKNYNRQDTEGHALLAAIQCARVWYQPERKWRVVSPEGVVLWVVQQTSAHAMVSRP